ncbi:MAG: SPOR domain-containing protein [Candidatus Neomarinimicrobiota bacterium]
MRTFIPFLLIFILLSCSGSGLEGFVNEPITITALDPDESQDFDYFWSVENQPDGSLINSRDLKTSNGGKEMIFTPDYPGDYSVELVISKYGDEVDIQKFLFSILDQQTTSNTNEANEDKENNSNEDWLDDEYEDDEYEDDEYEDDEYEDDEYKDDEYEDDEYENDEYEDSEYENDEYEDDEYENDDPNQSQKQSVKPNNKKTILPSTVSTPKKTKKIKSIAQKTDRYTIQITSKKKLKDAQMFSKILLKKGYDVYIQKIVLDDNETWYRIRLGSYNNYNAAKKDAKIVSAELGFSVWVDFVRKEQK